MRLQDIGEVRSLWERSGIQLTKSDEVPELERMLSHNSHLCLVGELCGNSSQPTVVAAVLGGFDGRRGWIHHLAVDPNHQRLGFGRLLMEELVRRFKADGVVKLKLEVLESNKNVIRFYQAIGWDLRPEITTLSLSLSK